MKGTLKAPIKAEMGKLKNDVDRLNDGLMVDVSDQFTAINDGDIFSIKAFLIAKKILVLNITLKCIQEHQSDFCDVITSPLIGKLETVGTALSINNYSSDIAEGYAICYREQRSIRIKFTRANATYCISGAVVLKQMD